MSFDLRNLRQLGSQVSISLPTDERGYLGRECPDASCLGYFLVRPGTGLTGDNLPCHCPYCGTTKASDEFYTTEQIEYAKSVAMRRITDAIRSDLKQLEFDHPAQGPFGIGISMKMQPGAPVPIRTYREKALETFVTCTRCSLEYGVYGVFAYCPDCGAHNSIQILEQNLDLAKREADLANAQQDPAFQRHLIEDALENCVSAFDGFAREAVRIRAQASTEPGRCPGVSFQNLVKAQVAVEQLFGFDFACGLPDGIWATAQRGFMKRHVIAHRSGVVDQAYLDQTNDTAATIGRRVPLDPNEVARVADAVLQLGRSLVGGLPPIG